MRLQNIPLIVALAGLACAGNPATAAPWTRGFVVATYEYAFRYGGRASFARAGEIEPGVDCPHGSSTHFANEDQTRKALALQKWRGPGEVSQIVQPPGLDQVRAPVSPASSSGTGPYPIAATGTASKPMSIRSPPMIPASRKWSAASAMASTWTARSGRAISSARTANAASTMRCTAPGAAMRPGAAMAMRRWTCAPTTRCRKASTPWSSAFRATKTR